MINLPNFKEYNTVPPDMNYRYFEYQNELLLEPLNKSFSQNNAWWLAEFSFLVYCHSGFARMACELAGFDSFQFFEGVGTECLIASNDSVAVLAFRGTEQKSSSTLYEIHTDLNAKPIAFENGGVVHRGFLTALDEVWGGDNGVEESLKRLQEENPNRPIWVCGHSLGGALSLLTLARMPELAGAYIFGAPRVGNQEFVNLIKQPVFRIENYRDPVPLLPPSIMKLDFQDVGERIYLDKDGELFYERPRIDRNYHRELVNVTNENQKENARAVKAEWKALQKEIETNGLPRDISQATSKIKEHLSKSGSELKRHIKEVNETIGFNIDDHMPIYYAVKLLKIALRS